MLTLEQAIMARVVRDTPSGSYVNLGIGIPILALEFWGDHSDVRVHSENGVLGMRALAVGEGADPDLTHAGKQPVGLVSGGSYFDHVTSFAIMRGGHLDLSVLGAYEVSSSGDIANWSLGLPEQAPAVGGAMDLVVGAKRVFVAMRHRTSDGRSRLVSRCSLPVTGSRVVDRVYTELATIDIEAQGFTLREVVAGVTVQDVVEATGAPLAVPASVVEVPAERKYE